MYRLSGTVPTTFVKDSFVNFIPVARIVGHCAVAETNVKRDYGIDKVIVCVPLLKMHFWY